MNMRSILRQLKRYWPWLRLSLAALASVAIILPPLWCGMYAVLPVFSTPVFIARNLSGKGTVRIPRAIGDISENLVRAVIAAEDQRFCSHRGFDWQQIGKAQAENKYRRVIRGASTISQQTAKNVFLWPSRSWLRKGLEAYFTFFIEAFWSKRLIMETYLNVAEWGPGLYGAEAAARFHFSTDAKALTLEQAALLASILPNPQQWRVNPAGPYVSARALAVQAQIAGSTQKAAACVLNP